MSHSVVKALFRIVDKISSNPLWSVAMAHELLTAKEVADRFRVSIQTVYRWGQDGTLQRVQVGGTVRFRHHDVTALLAANDATEAVRP